MTKLTYSNINLCKIITNYKLQVSSVAFLSLVAKVCIITKASLLALAPFEAKLSFRAKKSLVDHIS